MIARKDNQGILPLSMLPEAFAYLPYDDIHKFEIALIVFRGLPLGFIQGDAFSTPLAIPKIWEMRSVIVNNTESVHARGGQQIHRILMNFHLGKPLWINLLPELQPHHP